MEDSITRFPKNQNIENEKSGLFLIRFNPNAIRDNMNNIEMMVAGGTIKECETGKS